VQLTHLTPADYKVMPWKNGGGTTTEIMLEPEIATGGYVWRLSLATVAQSGPFSNFSGYDRTIMLVEGKGFVLDSAEAPQHQLVRSFEPYRFDGAWKTGCTLIDGPAKDFNLIARKDAHAALEVLRLVPGETDVPPAPTIVLHLFHGQIAVNGTSITAGDTLRIEGPTAPIRLEAARPSIVGLVRIGGR
jgi:uncharacterized protein